MDKRTDRTDKQNINVDACNILPQSSLILDSLFQFSLKNDHTTESSHYTRYMTTRTGRVMKLRKGIFGDIF